MSMVVPRQRKDREKYLWVPNKYTDLSTSNKDDGLTSDVRH